MFIPFFQPSYSNGGYGGKYSAPPAVKYVPLPHHELPVLIYQSDNAPPIHVVHTPRPAKAPSPPKQTYAASKPAPAYNRPPPPPTKPAYSPPKTTKPAYKPPKPTKPAYKPPPPTKPAYKPPAKQQKLVTVQLKPKRALLSSTYISKRYNLPAKKCIDGKYNYHSMCHTKAWGVPPRCGHSSPTCAHVGEPAPWFALDNGVQVSVAKTVLINRKDIIIIIITIIFIVIIIVFIIITVLVNRKDCCGKRTRNVEVRLSDQLPLNGQKMFTGGHLLGTFAGPGRSGQRIEIDSEKGWENKSGRYLVIQMDNGKDPLNLQEVFAFGKRVL